MTALSLSSSCHGADSPADVAAALSDHRPYLVRFAARRLRDAALVEDVVQETLLAALQQAACFEHRSSLRTWLTGILQRRIADSVRRGRRHPRAGHDDAAGDDGIRTNEDDDTGAGDEAIDWIDPQRRLEDRQFLAALAACLEDLPPDAARMFTLREIDGFSNEEAASTLGLSPRSSAVLLHRTRARLRAGLAAHGSAGRREIAP